MFLDPFVVKNTLQVQAILGLIFQQLADYVTGAACNVCRKSQVDTKQNYLLTRCSFWKPRIKNYLQILLYVSSVFSSSKGGLPTRNS